MLSKNFSRLYVPVYALTLLLSAFLLFLVQPMFGKIILPLLGGSPSVWNTAMLFFQTTLLAGYAYAHGTSRIIGVRAQALLHIALLCLFLLFLPIAVPQGWTPPTDTDPTFWQLTLMAVAVGGPFFVLSGSAPLLQHWFAHTKHHDAGNPYFLYAASNLGSMTALLAYPFVVEPALDIAAQSGAWTCGYGLLIICVIAAALLAWSHATPERKDIALTAPDIETVSWQRRFLWLGLAFVPSSLMLGVTSFITTDLATVPLLWILPLALYVGTFIIAFAKKPAIGLKRTYYVQGILLVMVLSFIATGAGLSKVVIGFVHLLLFFFTALMCHQQLSATKPTSRHLTQFYLVMSIGGALGGLFNALLAPHLFVVPLEYGIVLILGVLMRECTNPEKSAKASWQRFNSILKAKESRYLLRSGVLYLALTVAGIGLSLLFKDVQFLHMLLLVGFVMALTMAMDKRWIFTAAAAIILLIHPPGIFWASISNQDVLYQSRNFFGTLRVADSPDKGIRTLLNGTTVHGTQALAAEHKMLRLSYYSDNSGIADAFRMADDKQGTQKIAALGLGTGAMSCFSKEGRSFDFFEINPKVVEVAQNRHLFTYLSDCGSPYEIVHGDARLKLAEQPDERYDVIVLDVFSSDSIPVHLLTMEAFETYRSKLTKDGFIIVNISNRYLQLRPVIAGAAEKLGMRAYAKKSRDGYVQNLPFNASEFMVLTAQTEHFSYLEQSSWDLVTAPAGFRLWTDSYSNILSLLKIFETQEKPDILLP